MSHSTLYVQMVTSRTLGASSGDGRLDANRFYTREQTEGGSKCSNDTVSTVFDALHGSDQTDIKPPIFRKGYDAYGLIPGAGASTAALVFDVPALYPGVVRSLFFRAGPRVAPRSRTATPNPGPPRVAPIFLRAGTVAPPAVAAAQPPQPVVQAAAPAPAAAAVVAAAPTLQAVAVAQAAAPSGRN